MRKSLLLLGFLLPLLFMQPARTLAQDAQAAEAELNQVTQGLEKLYERYNTKVLNDPENEGARSMLDALSAALNAIEAFKIGGAKPSRVYMEANKSHKEARRYDTDDARIAVRLLDRLKAIAPNLPGAENDTEALEEIREEEDPTPSVDDLPPAEVEPADTAQAPAKTDQNLLLGLPTTGFFLVIGLLVLMFMIAIVFTVLLRKSTRASQERIVELEKRLENLEYVGDSKSSTDAVKTSQLGKRVDTLEKNTMGFMEELESRIASAQSALDDLNKNSGQHQASTQVLSEELESVKLLKTRLDIIEARIESGAIASDDDKLPEPSETAAGDTVINQIVPKGIVKSRGVQLIELLRTLKDKTKIAALNRLIGEVIPGLEDASNSGNLNDINLTTLGEAIQLAFVSGQNEDNRVLYEKIRDAIEQIGFKITDKMTGRQAFSDYYADNIPFDEYITMPKVRTEAYPSHEAAKQEIENSPLLHDSLKNTVLYTLRPTIQVMERGAQRVIAKGEFVVQA